MRKKLLLVTSLLISPLALAEQAIVGNAEAGKQKIAVCATCHGEDGNSQIPANPNLAGQHAEYIIRALTEYQQGVNGPRNNPIMMGMAAGLSAQDIADIAAYYSSQTEKVGEADPALVKQGEALYRGGDAARGIPACMACHGPVGQGNEQANFPKIANQNPDYVIAALKEYQNNNRINVMMNDIAKKMTDADIKAVATYVYGLYPAGMKLPEPPPATATPTATSPTATASGPSATSATLSAEGTPATTPAESVPATPAPSATKSTATNPAANTADKKGTKTNQ